MSGIIIFSTAGVSSITGSTFETFALTFRPVTKNVIENVVKIITDYKAKLSADRYYERQRIENERRIAELRALRENKNTFLRGRKKVSNCM